MARGTILISCHAGIGAKKEERERETLAQPSCFPGKMWEILCFSSLGLKVNTFLKYHSCNSSIMNYCTFWAAPILIAKFVRNSQEKKY